VTSPLIPPGAPETAGHVYAQRAERYRNFQAAEFRGEVDALLADHERYLDRECISLHAGANAPSPRVTRALASTIGSRPRLGPPGEKHETGSGHAEPIDVLARELLRRLFGCRFAEYRVGSGSLANLYAFMACARPGDTILSVPDAAAGPVTHHAQSAAGLYGLRVHDVPWDGARMTVDLGSLARDVRRLRPRVIVIGDSLALHPHPVSEVRTIADSVGAYVVFDAAHVAGLVAGGVFPQPLAEGAHVMTCSTYESFGGPPGSLLLTDSPDLAERLDHLAYPGLTTNFDLSRTAALVIAATDLLEQGRAYGAACIANAQALARELAGRGLPVRQVAGRGHTSSHQVAVEAALYGGGMAAARRLERANILASGIGLPSPPLTGDFNGLRLGTQEVTRWGMRPHDMATVARLLAHVLVDAHDASHVRADVVAFRLGFQQLHFVAA
jgi:glycine hydroxymethyltransferase